MNVHDDTIDERPDSAILRDLVERVWPAETRLKPNEIAPRYGMSVSSVREALIRLAARGFIDNPLQRGYWTITGTPESVSGQAGLRTAIEVEAARISIEQGDLTWEGNLAAAHHRLSHLEGRMKDLQNPSIEELRIWTQAEHDFHGALSAACGSKALVEAQRDAFIRFRLHLVSVYPGWGFRGEDSVREHETIVTAALKRDTKACVDAIRTHFAHFPRALSSSRPERTAWHG